MKNNPTNNQNSVLSAINKLGKSFRTELKKLEKTIRVEMLKIEKRVETLEEGQKRTEGKIDKISNQLDGFVGRVDDLTNDNEIGADQIHRLREDVKDHEKRIAKLESTN